jgi:hypothetical protein
VILPSQALDGAPHGWFVCPGRLPSQDWPRRQAENRRAPFENRVKM